MENLPRSVLDGVEEKINCHFFGREQFKGFSYKQKRSWNEICKKTYPSDTFDGYGLVRAMYKRIENNLLKRPVNRPPSNKNWAFREKRFEQSTVKTGKGKSGEGNKSDEVTLERAIVIRWPENWTYQMPVASGLFGPTEHNPKDVDKKRDIDLVYDHRNRCFDFVELKTAVRSGSPLYAAMEILGYGLIYLASRKDSAGNLKCYKERNLPVMAANAINLVVLAPSDYYGHCDVRWLQQGLDSGLDKLVKDMGVSGLAMSFCFEKFPENFEWKHNKTPDDLPKKLVREHVYP